MALYVFSQTINAFLRRVKAEALSILRVEVGAGTEGDTVRLPGLTFRLSVVLFEDSTRIGYFNPTYMEIGLHKKTMFIACKETVRNILRHEIAHMMVYLYLGEETASHGPAFHNYCKMRGWSDEVTKASIALERKEEGWISSGGKADAVIAKVKKLFALSSSDNPHEANAATLKANQLLLRHNISLSGEIGIDAGKEVYMKRVLETKRFSAKHYAIAEILRSFLVSPVLNHGKGLSYLEVTGERTNVEIADYVAGLLDKRLEELWQAARKSNPQMGGNVGRNSFMRGVAAGYREKVERASRDYTRDDGMALIKLERRLEEMVKLVYERLTRSRSRSYLCSASFGAGREQGKRLSIVKGVKEPSAVRPLLEEG
jgi:hypothetical protein